MPIKLSADEIDAKRTKAGGWTKATLALWGVPWPPPQGWRKALLCGDPISKKVVSDADCAKRKVKLDVPPNHNPIPATEGQAEQ